MKSKTIEKTILLVPLFIAFLWMGFVVLDAQSADPGLRLAPPRIDSLVNALFVFIIVYAIVLLAILWRMQKEEVQAVLPFMQEAVEKMQ